jgi:hypothetical protein
MLFSEQKELYLQKLRYRYFAYCVVRDAIGFYFGIPKFLQTVDFNTVVSEKVKAKVAEAEAELGRKPSSKELGRYRRSVEKSVKSRIRELEEDFEHCKLVLFEDNLWLNHLDLDVEFFKTYLPKLSEDVKNQLAVVPSWTTRDHSLGRPYLVDNKNVASIAF